MTGPRIDIGFDRAGAKRAGYTDAEIDAFLAQDTEADPFKPRTPKMASESTRADRDRPTGEMYANDPVQLARAAAQGATFKFADEIEAGVRAPFSKQTYDEIVTDVRGRNKQFAAEHPAANFAAEMGGGALTGGLALKLLKAAAPAVSPMGRVFQAVKTGGVVGGATGVGAGENAGERLRGGLTGAVVGAGAGATLSGIAEGVKKAAPFVRDVLAKPTGDAAREKALTKLAADLERDGMTLDDVMSRRAEFPDDVPMSVLDVGAENVKQRAAAVGAVPGKGRQTLTETLTARRAASGKRTIDASVAATGAPAEEVNLASRAMTKARDKAADVEYDAARKAGPILLEQRYQKLLDDPLIVKAYGTATDNAAAMGKQLTPLFDEVEVIGKNGAQQVRRVYDAPSVETLDAVYRELRDEANTLFRKGATNRARVVNKAAQKIATVLDDPNIGVPQYTKARQNFAAATRRIEARKAGRQFDKLQPEELSDKLANMAPDEAAQYRAGGVRRMAEKVRRRPDGMAPSVAIDRNPEMRDQAMALADPAKRGEFGKRLDADKMLDETFTKALVGSRTTPLKEGVADLGASEWATKAEDVLRSANGGIKQGAMQMLFSALKNRAAVGRGETAAELAKLYAQGVDDPREINALIAELRKFQQGQSAKALSKAPTKGIRPGAVGRVAGYLSGRSQGQP